MSARAGSPGNKITGNRPPHLPAISADGSQIAFYSSAADLVAGVRDLNGADDLFVYAVAPRTSVVGSLHAPGMASTTPDADSVLRGDQRGRPLGAVRGERRQPRPRTG